MSHTFDSVVLLSTRRPCIHASTYSAPSASTENSDLDTSTSSPIRVADKSKSRRRIKNVFIDERGFPDQSDKFDVLLHNINGGLVLQKLKHPPPQIGSVDPMFSFSYDEALHGKCLRKELDLSHLDIKLQQTLYAFASKILVCLRHARCFCPGPQLRMCNQHWVCTPYLSEKDHVRAEQATNNAKSCGGSRKSWPDLPNHRRTLALQGGPCAQTSSRTCLTHRRLCMALNSVTLVIAYPIQRCNAAVSKEYGTEQWMWLFDAPSGYHQLAVALG